MKAAKRIIRYITTFQSIGLILGECLLFVAFICFFAFLILGFVSVSTLGAEKSKELGFCNTLGVEKIEELFADRDEFGFDNIKQENYPVEQNVGERTGLDLKTNITDISPVLKKVTVELEGNFCHETMVVFIGKY